MLWPSITSEAVPWCPQPEGIATTSRRARRSIPTSYPAAVVPEIATVSVELPGDVAADLDDATRLLTAFDAGGAGEVAPFAAILLRSESAASSHIENLTSSARALAEAAIGAGDRTNAIAVLANVRTMQAAMDLAGDLDVASILSMHRALMTGQQRFRPGRWRGEQVWIGGTGLHPGDA
ncbi:MAG TPA: Fic family protein, partial [Intrasporangium sp.]|nr:Fic family protein [Intrasporangium sp.]